MNNAEIQPNASPDVLSPTYYLDNFLCFLNSVEDRYGHLLEAEEIEFLVSFRAVSPAAQCLFVRLVSRKGPLFRVDKLRYPEIGELDEPIKELVQRGLLDRNPPVSLRQLLYLMTLPELKHRPELPRLLEQHSATPAWRSLRKGQLVELVCGACVESDDDGTTGYRVLGHALEVLSPAHDQTLARLHLLFFGNLGQDLTEFVLTDLGLVRYEAYALDGAATAFKSRDEVEALLEAYQWRQALYQALEAGDLVALAALRSAVPDSDFPPARRTLSKAINLLARECERKDELTGALELYRHSSVPPARERIARILYAAEDWLAAQAQCTAILQDPWSEQEAEAARRVLTRCQRRLGQPPAKVPPRRLAVTTVELGAPSGSVELQALDFLVETQGGEGFYVENWLFNTLFGLLFWDIVFAPVADAFYHPFQRGPRDLYRPEFRHKREKLLTARLDQVLDGRWVKDRVTELWSAKFGVANPFVSWTSEAEPRLAVALERIPPRHLQAVFSRMLLDLRHHCSGFPDLIWFPPRGGYELVEVKGPGDRVQDNQGRWMAFFQEQGITARVVQVMYTGDAEGTPTELGSSATL